jgi:hypothetical protein
MNTNTCVDIDMNMGMNADINTHINMDIDVNTDMNIGNIINYLKYKKIPINNDRLEKLLIKYNKSKSVIEKRKIEDCILAILNMNIATLCQISNKFEETDKSNTTKLTLNKYEYDNIIKTINKLNIIISNITPENVALKEENEELRENYWKMTKNFRK